MNVLDILDTLQNKALHDEQLRQTLLATRTEKNPITAFCKKCQELGYPIYEMDLIQAGEEFYASMRRSTNGVPDIPSRMRAVQEPSAMILHILDCLPDGLFRLTPDMKPKLLFKTFI